MHKPKNAKIVKLMTPEHTAALDRTKMSDKEAVLLLQLQLQVWDMTLMI